MDGSWGTEAIFKKLQEFEELCGIGSFEVEDMEETPSLGTVLFLASLHKERKILSWTFQQRMEVAAAAD